MRSRGNIRRQFKLGVRRIIRLAPGTAAWWQQTQTALGEARYQPRRYSDRYQTWCLCCSFGCCTQMSQTMQRQLKCMMCV